MVAKTMRKQVDGNLYKKPGQLYLNPLIKLIITKSEYPDI